MAHWISRSVEETLSFARELAQSAMPGDVIYLSGNLGAGKTTFTQGFCKALGYNDFVHSPSYALIHHYENDPPIFHLDLYRIEEEDGVYDLGLDYYPLDKGIVLIEWPQGGVHKMLPAKMVLSFENLSETERLISVEYK